MNRIQVRHGLPLALLFVGLSGTLQACSSKEDSDNQTGGTTGTGGTTSASGGGGSPDGLLGTFQLKLNPAIGDAAPYTSVFGNAYASPYPTDVIETSVASNDACAVYKYSLQSCTSPTCTGSQTCTATNVCKDKPSLVSVGDVTLDGVGSTQLKLSATSNNYQYPVDLPYPGFDDGGTVTLSATGGAFAAFSMSTKGVAPAELEQSTYQLSPGKGLTLNWTKGSASTGAKIRISLNISKHGGSAGYMKCETTDSGSLTIPANLVQALLDLGVAGFPELLFTRSSRAEASVSAGKIALTIDAEAKPSLNIEGYCSCFNSSECGTCSDTTKTVCNSVTKLCHAP